MDHDGVRLSMCCRAWTEAVPAIAMARAMETETAATAASWAPGCRALPRVVVFRDSVGALSAAASAVESATWSAGGGGGRMHSRWGGGVLG
jgi:hypothetical protein